VLAPIPPYTGEEERHGDHHDHHHHHHKHDA
jgi:hypothetical protein